MDEYYRVSDAAKLLHIDRKTLYRWIKQGKIPQRWLRTFPNGMIAINGRGLTQPKRKKYTKIEKISRGDLENVESRYRNIDTIADRNEF